MLNAHLYLHFVFYFDVIVWWGHWILQHNCGAAPPEASDKPGPWFPHPLSVHH